MTARKTQKSTGNSGIQANNVTAEVMAVGNRAAASKVVNTGVLNRELPGLIAELRNSLGQLSLQPLARQALEEDVGKLDRAAKGKSASPGHVGSILSGIVGKLKMVGIVMSDAVALAEPIKKIVGLLGIPLPW